MVKLREIAIRQGLVPLSSFSESDTDVSECFLDTRSGKIGCVDSPDDISERAEGQGVMNLIQTAYEIESSKIKHASFEERETAIKKLKKQAGLPEYIDVDVFDIEGWDNDLSVSTSIDRSLAQGKITQEEADRAKEALQRLRRSL